MAVSGRNMLYKSILRIENKNKDMLHLDDENTYPLKAGAYILRQAVVLQQSQHCYIYVV
jgi:hypothetical protein